LENDPVSDPPTFVATTVCADVRRFVNKCCWLVFKTARPRSTADPSAPPDQLEAVSQTHWHQGLFGLKPGWINHSLSKNK
jgi:hypothetical protein